MRYNFPFPGNKSDYLWQLISNGTNCCINVSTNSCHRTILFRDAQIFCISDFKDYTLTDNIL